ncbi:MAG: hypothetical protein ACT4UQ_11930 [Gammaproteobacteria bacterium]
MHIDIVSAEGQILTGNATMILAPACQGTIGIALRCAPLLAMRRRDAMTASRPERTTNDQSSPCQ